MAFEPDRCSVVRLPPKVPVRYLEIAEREDHFVLRDLGPSLNIQVCLTIQRSAGLKFQELISVCERGMKFLKLSCIDVHFLGAYNTTYVCTLQRIDRLEIAQVNNR